MAKQQRNSTPKSKGTLSGMEQLAALYAQMNQEKSAEEEKAEQARREAAYKRALFVLEQQKEDRAKRKATKDYRPSESERTEDQLRKKIMAERTASAIEKKDVSRAKAAGLKSILTISQDEMLMTSFGRGNDAVCEKKVVGTEIQSIAQEPKFSAQTDGSQFRISGRVTKDATSDNPQQSQKTPGDDLIGCRKQLERLFFDDEFEDNIHIQLAYGILDIDKILSIHINNIIYELNNMLRADTLTYDDVVGSLGLDCTYDEFWKKTNNAKRVKLQDNVRTLLSKPQLAYFGSVLYDPALVKKVKTARNNYAKDTAQAELRNKERQAYDLLTLLGMIRQSLAHGTEGSRLTLFTLDPNYDSLYTQGIITGVDLKQREAARGTLNELYAERIAQLNDGFLDKAKVDLSIIFSLYNAVLAEQKKPLVKDYYDFIVRKNYKNQGFSVKHLREIMLLEDGTSQLLSTEFDSMRARLYRSIDFIIFEYYQKHAAKADKLVESLRGSMEESQKEAFYQEEAKALWPEIRSVVLNDLLPWMSGDELAQAKKAAGDQSITADMIEEVAVKPTVMAFSKLIYLMTCFQDGKEINDLLTTLINKFETIASFIAVMKEQGIACKFAKGYQLFNRSAVIAEELRAINSFARMSKPEPDAKRSLFIEAAEVLGYPGTEEELGKYIDDVLTAKGEFVANGKGFRNFIANNVIESDRFKYLVRYSNVKNIRKLADNKHVIGFVLKGIPDTQIIRYYNSCTGENRANCTPDMREVLTRKITGISFAQFASVKQKAAQGSVGAVEKVRMQALIRLYLTVLYMVVKNLVYVNSRYFLAFHCVERDSILYDPQRFSASTIRKDYAGFAKLRIEQGNFNNRVTAFLKQNLDNSSAWGITTFRNQVEHLNAVRGAHLYIADIGAFSSYFELYHYLMQRSLEAKYREELAEVKAMIADGKEWPDFFPKEDSKFARYFGLVIKHNGYCKDMVKALNVPFAYNLPRYKNLSIGDLFDRNHYLPTKKEAIAPEEQE